MSMDLTLGWTRKFHSEHCLRLNVLNSHRPTRGFKVWRFKRVEWEWFLVDLQQIHIIIDILSSRKGNTSCIKGSISWFSLLRNTNLIR
jgi:hypothetical protein